MAPLARTLRGRQRCQKGAILRGQRRPGQEVGAPLPGPQQGLLSLPAGEGLTQDALDLEPAIGTRGTPGG